MNVNNYIRPKSLDEAYNLLLEDDKNVIIGGGAWLKLQNKEINSIIDLSAVCLNEIIEQDDYIEIGAMASLRQIETSDIITEYHDGILSKAVKHIMGMNIRNLATIGGSVMGKYSFSDILAPLLVMDTSLVFFNSGVISLQEYLNTKKFPKDILTAIRIKKEKAHAYYYTVKKQALDFAVINFAISKTDVIKIAVGARPGMAKRAFKSEELLHLKPLNETLLNDVTNSILKEISLSSNSRASKAYRVELLKVYIKRGLSEVMKHEG